MQMTQREFLSRSLLLASSGWKISSYKPGRSDGKHAGDQQKSGGFRSALYYSRGFQIDNYMVDGIPTILNRAGIWATHFLIWHSLNGRSSAWRDRTHDRDG